MVNEGDYAQSQYLAAGSSFIERTTYSRGEGQEKSWRRVSDAGNRPKRKLD